MADYSPFTLQPYILPGAIGREINELEFEGEAEVPYIWNVEDVRYKKRRSSQKYWSRARLPTTHNSGKLNEILFVRDRP